MAKDVTRLAYSIFWCGGSDCSKNGGKEVCKQLRREVRDAGLKSEVQFVKTSCTRQCKQAPVLIICPGTNAPENGAGGAQWYARLNEEDAAALVETQLQNGQPLEAKLLRARPEKEEN